MSVRDLGTWNIYHTDGILVGGKPGKYYILVGRVIDVRGEQLLPKQVDAVAWRSPRGAAEIRRTFAAQGNY